jgi:DNA replication protein DnaC
MSTPQLDRLQTYCHRLRLYQVATDLSTVLEQAAKHDRSYSDFLEELLSREVHAKGAKHLAMRLAMARLPFQKTLESFEFKFQPSIDPKVVRELATGRYLDHGENVLLLGPPGVGKTHLAVALGMKACEHGRRGVVHHRHGTDRQSRQSPDRKPVGGQAQASDSTASAHRR